MTDTEKLISLVVESLAALPIIDTGEVTVQWFIDNKPYAEVVCDLTNEKVQLRQE